ncbi:MAG: hypothetical protein GY894_10215 [Planctomycetes bacterium]|nr:hypothetical protein [Planctomycetota bacterium]
MAATLVAAASWCRPLRKRPVASGMLVVLAITIAAVWSFVASVGWPAWPPPQKWHAVPWLITIIGLWGMIDVSLPRGEWPARLVLATLGGVAAGWMLILPGKDPLTVGVVVGVAGLLTSLLDTRRRSVLPLGGWAIAASLSLLALIASQMTLSLMAGAVSGSLAAVWLIRLISPSPEVGLPIGGAVLGGVLAVITLTAWSYDYQQVPSWAWLVVAAGVPGACMLEIGSLRCWHGALALSVRSLVLVSPAVAVVLILFEAVKGAMRG